MTIVVIVVALLLGENPLTMLQMLSGGGSATVPTQRSTPIDNEAADFVSVVLADTEDAWTKIFAVSFAMGVVSGIVLSYQLGTNWSKFSEVKILTQLVALALTCSDVIASCGCCAFCDVLVLARPVPVRWFHLADDRADIV